jgi:hypothetical protein
METTSKIGKVMKELPSRDVVLQKITAAMDGSLSREEVATWACSFMLESDPEVTDCELWEVIKLLGGADLIGIDRPYLYGEEDLKDWAAQIR